jgi:serine/threonine protein kinase
MEYIAKTTDIPIPKLYCSFEDDGAVYLVMEYIEGVTMDQLNNDQRSVVEQELDLHCESLHKLRSKGIGGPSGLVSANVPFLFEST